MYRYVGQAELLELVRPEAEGVPLRSQADLDAWLATQEVGQEEPDAVVATYVVDLDGVLRVSPRRNEHVVCTGGREVLAAGEIAWWDDGELSWVTNQSTGYCPDVACWPSVAAALGAIGVVHPGFDRAFVFRRCEACGERNLVREGWFFCAICDAELPRAWNF
jgi:hypothetical protein